ncbi:hypothetical protein C8F04DRAFT_1263825 [Mycena alexandri]|uniref:CxC2-like cysteine cluster KDZ transposase-associated domain-containing protein n=1 Tax=Mycena alexandri TaxID=1745969 RepID=A0AAD6SM87_9AGAR|nr:hypothetical protein C8F04DRAFT_1263825 [Mycena alexandri]
MSQLRRRQQIGECGQTHIRLHRLPRTNRRRFDVFDDVMGYSADDEQFLLAGGAPEGVAGIRIKKKSNKAPRNRSSDRPLLPWIHQRNSFQDALLRREGRGPWWPKGCMSPTCLEMEAEYRCEDCFGGRLLCKGCMVEHHRDEPMHLLQKWSDGYFQRCSMKSIAPGIRFQIGHPPGGDCMFRNGPHPFVVLDNNGIHELDVDFCGCIGCDSINHQLLNIGWFPATGRVPAYDLYNALEVLSDHAGMIELPMCKRCGRGHDGKGVPVGPGSSTLAYGIDATQRGEVGHPVSSLSASGGQSSSGLGESSAGQGVDFYQLLLSEDANFKMKGRATSNREDDPTLGPGFAYMVAHDKYLKHLAEYSQTDEISHCVAFAALGRANNKCSKGLRATGIGSKGEKYSNMDYLFFSTLMGVTLLSIVASYDIACQWFRNFWERMAAMPKAMQLQPGVKLQFKVPKFHLPPHIKKCHGPFSFNYTKWVGRTDGEGGSREDTIDDFCGYANWRKTVGLGNSLLRKLVLAIPKAMLHGCAFHAFTEGVREGHEDEYYSGSGTFAKWEQDHSKPCPYKYPEETEMSMEDVRQRIAEEEHARAEKRPSKTNRPGALVEWLESEVQEEESTARPEGMRLHLPSSLSAVTREEICIAGLVEEEERLREAQAVEGLHDLRRQLRTRTCVHQFKRKQTNGQWVYTKSQALQSGIEARVKAAASQYNRARAALLGLRGPGKWEEKFKVLKQSDIRGMNERTLNEEEKEEERRARALAGLPRDGEEVDEFGDRVETTVLFNLETGEGARQLSWLWYTGATGDTTEDGRLHDDIRIEWTKARARADRWREEVILLEEEMWRVLEFCKWKARWWEDRTVGRPDASNVLAEGVRAYTLEQVTRERFWATSWERKWAAVRARAALALSGQLVDVTSEVALEVEVEDEVVYGCGGIMAMFEEEMARVLSTLLEDTRRRLSQSTLAFSRGTAAIDVAEITAHADRVETPVLDCQRGEVGEGELPGLKSFPTDLELLASVAGNSSHITHPDFLNNHDIPQSDADSIHQQLHQWAHDCRISKNQFLSNIEEAATEPLKAALAMLHGPLLHYLDYTYMAVHDHSTLQYLPPLPTYDNTTFATPDLTQIPTSLDWSLPNSGNATQSSPAELTEANLACLQGQTGKQAEGLAGSSKVAQKPRCSHFNFTEPQTIRAVAGCRNAFMEALYHAEVLLWNHSTMQLEQFVHPLSPPIVPLLSTSSLRFPRHTCATPFSWTATPPVPKSVWHALLRIGRDELAGLLHQLLVLRFRDDYALMRLFNTGFLEEQHPEATHRSWDLLNDLTKPLPRTSCANHNDTASTSHVPNTADVEIDSAMPDLDSSEYELGYPASNYERRHEKENDEDMDDVADDSSNMDVGSSVGSDFYSYCSSPDALTRHSV